MEGQQPATSLNSDSIHTKLTTYLVRHKEPDPEVTREPKQIPEQTHNIDQHACFDHSLVEEKTPFLNSKG